MIAREKLRAWRGTMSQRAAGKLIGCSQSMVGALEAGTKRPKIDLATKIETATNKRIRVKEWATPVADSSPRAGAQ